MSSSPLATLPIELFFRILDFLEPHEYSGLSCTCRYAVTLVNRKLDNPKDQEKLWSGFELNERRTLRTQLPPWKIRTARYVDEQRREENKKSSIATRVASVGDGKLSLRVSRPPERRRSGSVISSTIYCEWILVL